MQVLKGSLRPAVGLFIIAHGLAHAVLPLRGLMNPVTLPLDSTPAILYAVAVIGFVVSGFGVLGLRPFTIVTRQVLAIASVLSLVAIWRLGDPGLWFGATTDVVLVFSALIGAHEWLPAPHESRGPWHHALGVVFATAFITYTICGTALWPAHRAWGSEAAEHLMALPGDAPDRNPSLEIQHAITIDAPPETVWPLLERAVGGEPATLVDPGRSIVSPDRGAFVLVPTADGKTRFIIRTTVSHGRPPVWAAAMDFMAFQLPHFIMERRMMLTIKELAERRAATDRLTVAERWQ